jgi:primosomal protein N'
LLNKPYHTDGVYDYRIPTELEESVCEGSFVTVPFGVSNATSLGVVWELKESSEYGEVKCIASVCPDHLSLDEEMLGLCAFMRQRTLCTTGDAVRAMVPASAISKLCERYAVNR